VGAPDGFAARGPQDRASAFDRRGTEAGRRPVGFGGGGSRSLCVIPVRLHSRRLCARHKQATTRMGDEDQGFDEGQQGRAGEGHGPGIAGTPSPRRKITQRPRRNMVITNVETLNPAPPIGSMPDSYGKPPLPHCARSAPTALFGDEEPTSARAEISRKTEERRHSPGVRTSDHQTWAEVWHPSLESGGFRRHSLLGLEGLDRVELQPGVHHDAVSWSATTTRTPFRPKANPDVATEARQPRRPHQLLRLRPQPQ